MQLRRQTLILIAALCIALAATFFFGFRAGKTARHVHWKNEAIRGWMTVPFVAHTRHVHEEMLFRAIGVTPDRHDRRPLRDIARAEHKTTRQLIDQLEGAIAANENKAP